MRLCAVGMGGCGGSLVGRFLKDRDVLIKGWSIGSPLSSVSGIWIDADATEAGRQKRFHPQSSGYPHYLILHSIIPSTSRTSRLVQEKYGYDLKKQGFFRQAEFLKAVFEIFQADEEVVLTAQRELGSGNPILRYLWESIYPYTSLYEARNGRHGLCDGMVLAASLGGGTGTGLMDPLARYIRSKSSTFPILALGILTENGLDSQQGADEQKRNLSAMIAINDLMTEPRSIGLDGLILADNQVLFEKFGREYSIIDDFIQRSLSPLISERPYPGQDLPGLALREQLLETLESPPILIPCYSQERGSGRDVVNAALDTGRLCECDPGQADRAYVFFSSSSDVSEIKDAIYEKTGLKECDVLAYRRLPGQGRDQVLILLRNPLGRGSINDPGTLECRLYWMTQKALGYIEGHRPDIIYAGMPDLTKSALESYFYGGQGLSRALERSLSSLEQGHGPAFQEGLKIFDGKSLGSALGPAWHGLQEDHLRRIARAEIEKMLQSRDLPASG
ncbi:MAG TPA: hypothetical protein VN455_10165 [Methanotrichaceae archaeon]|nr:hypothetical protein [Methanotrichaceae archaeon]